MLPQIPTQNTSTIIMDKPLDKVEFFDSDSFSEHLLFDNNLTDPKFMPQSCYHQKELENWNSVLQSFLCED